MMTGFAIADILPWNDFMPMQSLEIIPTTSSDMSDSPRRIQRPWPSLSTLVVVNSSRVYSVPKLALQELPVEDSQAGETATKVLAHYTVPDA